MKKDWKECAGGLKKYFVLKVKVFTYELKINGIDFFIQGYLLI